MFFHLPEHGSNRDEQIDVGTESGNSSKGTSDRREDCNGAKHHTSGDVSNCRLSPELPHGPAYITGEHPGLEMDAGKPKIWSVTDFLGSAGAHHPHHHLNHLNHHHTNMNLKDMAALDGYSKLDLMKTPHMDYGGMSAGLAAAESARSAAMMNRSAVAASSAISSLSSPAQQLQAAYQSSLGYGTAAANYSYSLSSFHGAAAAATGKLLRPSVTSIPSVHGAAPSSGVASSRFSPFPNTRPMAAMDSSPYAASSRRELGLARDGE